MPYPVAVEPGEIAARFFLQGGKLAGRDAEAVENEWMAREQADQPGAEQRFDLGLKDAALLGEVASSEDALGAVPEEMGEAVQETNEPAEQSFVIEALGEEGDAALAE